VYIFVICKRVRKNISSVIWGYSSQATINFLIHSFSFIHSFNHSYIHSFIHSFTERYSLRIKSPLRVYLLKADEIFAFILRLLTTPPIKTLILDDSW